MLARNPKSSDNLDWRSAWLVFFSIAATSVSDADMSSFSTSEMTLIHLLISLLSIAMIVAISVFHWESMTKFTRLTRFWRVTVVILPIGPILFVALAVSREKGVPAAEAISIFALLYAIWSMLAEMFLEKFFSSRLRNRVGTVPSNRELRRYAVKFWLVFGLRLLSGATIGNTESPLFSWEYSDLFLPLDTVIATASLTYLSVISYRFLRNRYVNLYYLILLFVLSIIFSFVAIIFLHHSSVRLYLGYSNIFQPLSFFNLTFIGLLVWLHDSSSSRDVWSVPAAAAASDAAQALPVAVTEAVGRDLDEPRFFNEAAKAVQGQEMTMTVETQATTRRRGWTLPDPRPEARDPSPQPAEQPVSEPSRPFAGQQLPKQTMAGSVAGQVTDVEQATLQGGQVSTPIVTLRLERNDPRLGRMFVVSVRLSGSHASGFADVGDWIEASGRQGPAFLIASRCVNHTTGAVYIGLRSRWPWARWGVQAATLVVGLAVFLVVAYQLNQQFNQTGRQMQADFERTSRDMQTRFENAGSPTIHFNFPAPDAPKR